MSVAAPALIPRYPHDAVRLRPREAMVYKTALALAHVTGRWRSPSPRSGDFETMRFLDKLYWLYKSGHPIRQAERGSGLEAFFAEQGRAPVALPPGFEPTGELSLSAVGDLMNHPYLAGSAASLYANVAELVFGVDVAMGNLECVVLDRSADVEIDSQKGASLALSGEQFRVVSGAGERAYDLLACACNHSLDFGEAGVASTIEALRARGVAFHGVNEREEDAGRAVLIERRGFRLGVVAHTFGLGGKPAPAHRPGIVNRTNLNEAVHRVDLTVLRQQLRHCEASKVDFVVAHLHWGMEFELFPRRAQVAVAHRLAELGVDLIIGHHPHVLQPFELYRTQRDPRRVVPIFYSLGNLVVPFSAPYLCRSGIARVDLARGTDSGGATRTYVRSARVLEVDQVADETRGEIALRAVVP